MNNIRIIRSASVCGRSVFAIVLVVLFASTIVLASTPQGTFEKTLTVSGPVDLEVLTHSGDVTVRAGSSGSVFIRGKIYVGNHWLSSNRDADVHEIEQHPPIRQEAQLVVLRKSAGFLQWPLFRKGDPRLGDLSREERLG